MGADNLRCLLCNKFKIIFVSEIVKVHNSYVLGVKYFLVIWQSERKFSITNNEEIITHDKYRTQF